MAGSKRPARRRCAIVLGLALSLATHGLRAAEPPSTHELDGASPGERVAIGAICDSGRGPSAQSLCRANQAIGLLRLGRKPDLSVASLSQRQAILDACPPKPLIGEQFACERTRLAEAHLPVRDEPGGRSLHIEATSDPIVTPVWEDGPKIPLAFFSLEKWRQERPQMPGPHIGPALSQAALYDLVAPSVYIVLASAHPIELAERVPHAQGSAVAIAGSVLLTNCHVLEGRPQISISQGGKTNRAHLVYADPGGDRCFIKSDAPVHPVPGIERFDHLKLGEPVYSIGAPGGAMLSIGTGYISSFKSFEGVRMIQNTASIARGSSGGGLFDDRGNLVGITTKIYLGLPNTYFSIAADDFWP